MLHHSKIVRTTARALGLALSLSFAGASFAQYKWENPDGTVGYGDVPPSRPVKMLKTPAGEVKAPTEESATGLPYALKHASTRFPVVLYTGAPATGECGPCKEGREFLAKRGIPYLEKIVKSAEEVKNYKANFSPDGSMPVLTVGKEKAVGFEGNAWSNLLDAAGYPKTSALPKGYKQASAESMTKPAKAAAAAAAGSDADKAEKSEPKGTSRGAKNKPPANPGMVDANADAKIRF